MVIVVPDVYGTTFPSAITGKKRIIPQINDDQMHWYCSFSLLDFPPFSTPPKYPHQFVSQLVCSDMTK